jgi:hypothetical protein
MKKILVIIALSLLLSGNAFSFNFKQTLNDYKKQNTGVESDIYMMNRCSAVFNWQASNLIKINDIETSKAYLGASEDMLKYSIIIYSKTRNLDFESSKKAMSNRLLTLINFYNEDAKKLFLQTGNYLSGHIKDDLGNCAATLKMIKNN